ncbi:MAG: glycosyltransferase family 2 protein [Lachnospiraceae bacterium]|nr:glycosyltransferase family 2 protein [Lachnospiraceae bacterium]
MKLSVVIPCYDEADNIPLILERFDGIIKRDDIEVVLVDNGSTDSSPEVLNTLLPKYPFAKTIRVEVNQGYGYGIVQGLKVSTGEFIGWTHADMQTDPADLLKALDIIEKRNYAEELFIKGNRKGRPLFDQFFTSGMSAFETLYMGVKLYDVNAQPNVFSKKFFETWINPPKDFSLDLYALFMAQKSGLHIERFDVMFPKRVHGTSHWNTGLVSKWKFIKRTVGFSRKLKKGGIS